MLSITIAESIEVVNLTQRTFIEQSVENRSLLLYTDKFDLFSTVTTHKVIGRDLLQRRCLHATNILSIFAARMEVAAAGRMGRIGDLPFKDNALGAQARIGLGHG